MVDYRQVLVDAGVEISRHGQSGGNVGVNCPFCRVEGDPDPSFHLGINEQSGAWNCWRNPNHKGRNPHRFFAAVLGKSIADVEALIGPQNSKVKSEFDDVFKPGVNPFEEPEEKTLDKLTPAAVKLLKTFEPLSSPLAADHLAYVTRRMGLTGTLQTLMHYDLLRAGVAERWAGRLIMPVHINGELVSWVGRAIYPDVTPKYMALSADVNAEIAGKSLKTSVYTISQSKDGVKTLVLVEGMFDAFRMTDLISRETRMAVTFGTGVTPRQTAFIQSGRYERVVVMYDSDAIDKAMSVAKDVGGEVIDFKKHFPDVNDPGDLPSTDAVRKIIRELGL